MQRFDIINYLIDNYFPNSGKYLEIGVHSGDCFTAIRASDKSGVDPDPYASHVEFREFSDDFFKRLERGETRFPIDHKWDIIFIDGLHLADQCYRDVLNSMNHVSTNGFIVLHDTYPKSAFDCHSDLGLSVERWPNPWNGTVWKVVYYLRASANYDIKTVDTDYGVSIISMGKRAEPIDHYNKFFEYGQMKNRAEEDLGLISTDKFLELFAKQIQINKSMKFNDLLLASAAR